MKKCPKCNNEHEKLGRFCSRKCANSRVFSEKSKKIKSEKTTKAWERGSYDEVVRKEWSDEKKDALSKKMKTLKLTPWNKGKHWSEEKKKEFSEIKRKFYVDNPEKHPNKTSAGIRESYPEKMLREYFEQQGLIKGVDFTQQYKIDKYYVDFYIPKLNLGIEVDGERWHTNLVKEIERETVIKKEINLIRFKAKPLINKEHEKEINNIINNTLK